MYVNFETVEITFSAQECGQIYYDLIRSITDSIETHWINHPESFEKNESLRLNLIRHFAHINGRDYSEVLAELKQHLTNCIQKQVT
jgi:hypothetical protein